MRHLGFYLISGLLVAEALAPRVFAACRPDDVIRRAVETSETLALARRARLNAAPGPGGVIEIQNGPGGQALRLGHIESHSTTGGNWLEGEKNDVMKSIEAVVRRYAASGMMTDEQTLNRLYVMFHINRQRSQSFEFLYLSGTEQVIDSPFFGQLTQHARIDPAFLKEWDLPSRTVPKDIHATALVFHNPREIAYPKLDAQGFMVRAPENSATHFEYAHAIPIPETAQGKHVALINRFMIDPALTPDQRAFHYVNLLSRLKASGTDWVYVEASDPAHARLFQSQGFEIAHEVNSNIYGGEKVTILKAPLSRLWSNAQTRYPGLLPE
ncbi:MAG: hypothetical protein AB7F66_16580 [Bacteriovoracia bacterium]